MYKLISFVVLFSVLQSATATEPVSKSYFGGVAIESHDAVAYHQPDAIAQHRASKGEDDFTAQYKGAKWRFVSMKNRDAFVADPEKFSPAYNGYCANALSLGEGLVKTDGTHWQIFSDKLYLFYAAKGRERWLQGDFTSLKSDADTAWNAILDAKS